MMMMKEMTMMMKKIAHELMMPVTNVVVGVTDRRMFDEEGQHRRPPFLIMLLSSHFGTHFRHSPRSGNP
jgi:hypothetical protein